VLIGGGFFRVGFSPAGNTPNLEAATTADQRHFTSQTDLPAEIIRQNEPALLVRDGVLRARMQLPQKNAAVARADMAVVFHGGAHAIKFSRGHNDEELVCGIGQEDEFLGGITSPARGNSDAIFLIDTMAKFAGIKRLEIGGIIHERAGVASTLIHFPPLLTTPPNVGQSVSLTFQQLFPPLSSPTVKSRLLLIFSLLALVAFPLRAQEDNSDEIRASVVLNPDGSRTTYETDTANRKSTAVTTGADGKVRERINYELDENGRFSRGEVLGPKGQFRFFARYKYDANNRLSEEVHLDKDDNVVGKILFHYDAAGHETGYEVYDGAGKLLGETAPAAASPSKRK